MTLRELIDQLKQVEQAQSRTDYSVNTIGEQAIISDIVQVVFEPHEDMNTGTVWLKLEEAG